MKSSLVVTSWWSNCLGLRCLHNLVAYAPTRDIFVMQAGKSPQQMQYFRDYMPEEVTELHYPDHLAADDSPMREYLALTLMRDEKGVWFIDHDTFFYEDCRAWLEQADNYFAQSGCCFCIGLPRNGGGVTQPAYWLSPARWPTGLSSFDPIPFREKALSRRPDLHLNNGDLIMPQKDTLVQVRDELDVYGLVGSFPLTMEEAAQHPLSVFPKHGHIGGIYLYTGPVLDARFDDWMHYTVTEFERFFATCPPEWLAIEEPELLRRHNMFKSALGIAGEMKSDVNFTI
ncbi:MAG: hypothetical protein H6658_17975 [Ardenticatenaceae bacterium]|nr:hypothetical protein [Ardenticatenaceae bacterium]